MVGDETTKCNWPWKYDLSFVFELHCHKTKARKRKKHSFLRYDYLSILLEEKYKYYKTENANFEEIEHLVPSAYNYFANDVFSQWHYIVLIDFPIFDKNINTQCMPIIKITLIIIKPLQHSHCKWCYYLAG